MGVFFTCSRGKAVTMKLALVFLATLAVACCEVPETKVPEKDIDKCAICTKVLGLLNYDQLIAVLDIVFNYHDTVCVKVPWFLLCDKLTDGLMHTLKMLRLLLASDADPHLICDLAGMCGDYQLLETLSKGLECVDSECAQSCIDQGHFGGHCVDGKCECFFKHENLACVYAECAQQCMDQGHFGGHCVDEKCECFFKQENLACVDAECAQQCKDQGHFGGHCVDEKCECFFKEDLEIPKLDTSVEDISKSAAKIDTTAVCTKLCTKE